ncbi:MAG: rod shape-determining protein RodA [Patescibacteria group bacterium]|nr:rod shape-determining protein RodA [Patescibacteria group bacterium]
MKFYRSKGFDFFLFLFYLVIFSLGAFAILSTSSSTFQSQLIFFAIGIVLYFATSFFDISLFKKPLFVFILYILSLLLLAGLFVFGENIRGSVRWYNLKFFNFQPSEVVKIVEIVILAKILGPLSLPYLSVKKIILSFLIISPFVLLVAKQPDLGNALVLLGIWVFMVFYAGVNPKQILVFLLAIFLISYPVWNVLHDYQRQRVISFINPYADPLGSGYNVIQSIVAVGSGGTFGRGFGRGTQSHLRFLPEYRTDFIFAAFSEEWGFLGSLVLIIFYFGLLYKILAISQKAKDSFSALLSLGAFSLLFIQCVVNIGMNLGVLPVTGITLPLVSYGGSSLIATSIVLGLSQNIAIKNKLW